MTPKRIQRLTIANFLLLGVLACNGTFAAAFPTQTEPAPTDTATPPPATSTPGVILSSVSLHEENQNPAYVIKAQVPRLDGNTDPRVVNFNTAMMNLVNTEINEFKRGVSELPPNGLSPAYSLDVTYTSVLQGGNLWSFKFEFLGYTGGAHPYLNITTVNYDLAQDRQLALSDLFLPNSNYLEVISNTCLAELRKRFIDFDTFGAAGAAPKAENYEDWNITTDSLVITFDTYQVAPGASGPQTIILPYSELQAVIHPQGPLAGITP